MEEPTACRTGFSARRALAALAVFSSVGGAQVLAVHVVGRGLPCPFRAMTGVPCPLCGTTTAAVALLGGDVAGAWGANPFSVLLMVGLSLAAACWLLEAMGGPAVRAPGRLRHLWGDRLLLFLGALAMAFHLVRLTA